MNPSHNICQRIAEIVWNPLLWKQHQFVQSAGLPFGIYREMNPFLSHHALQRLRFALLVPNVSQLCRRAVNKFFPLPALQKCLIEPVICSFRGDHFIGLCNLILSIMASTQCPSVSPPTNVPRLRGKYLDFIFGSDNKKGSLPERGASMRGVRAR